jgi:hypothetical protein
MTEPAKKKPLHPYLCTPAYNGQVDSDFAHALADASFACGKAGINITAGIVGNVAFLELARNIFVKKFLTDEGLKDCTHLFFIDGDLQFEWRAFLGLLTSGMPICAGVYRRRMEDEDYPFKAAENPDGGGLWFVDDWLQCERVPTGFLCIAREVLEEMSKDAKRIYTADHPDGIPWLFELKHEPMDDKPMSVLIGEDYTFCDKYVAKYNQYIPVWSNLDFVHHGFKGNLWKWFEKEREKLDKGEPSKLGKPKTDEQASSAA